MSGGQLNVRRKIGPGLVYPSKAVVYVKNDGKWGPGEELEQEFDGSERS